MHARASDRVGMLQVNKWYGNVTKGSVSGGLLFIYLLLSDIYVPTSFHRT